MSLLSVGFTSMIGVLSSASRLRTRTRPPSIDRIVTGGVRWDWAVGGAGAEDAPLGPERVAARMHTQDVAARPIEPGRTIGLSPSLRPSRPSSTPGSEASHASGAPRRPAFGADAGSVNGESTHPMAVTSNDGAERNALRARGWPVSSPVSAVEVAAVELELGLAGVSIAVPLFLAQRFGVGASAGQCWQVRLECESAYAQPFLIHGLAAGRPVTRSRSLASRSTRRSSLGGRPLLTMAFTRRPVATYGNGFRLVEPFSRPLHLRPVATGCDRSAP